MEIAELIEILEVCDEKDEVTIGKTSLTVGLFLSILRQLDSKRIINVEVNIMFPEKKIEK